MMRHLVLPALFCCLAGLASAQEEETAPGDGLSLMERGAQLFLEGILREVEPAIDGLDALGPRLRDFASEMGPALSELLQRVEDWSVYEPPEVLPNGDIIIRRKEPLPPPEDGNAPIEL